MEACWEQIAGYRDVKFAYNPETKETDCHYTDDDGCKRCIPVAQLSDGYQNIIGLAADIAHCMAVVNPKLGADTVKETDGVVLIDEIELHLHPSLQYHVLKDLQQVFSKVQFIVTTNAPAVISGIKRDNLVIVKNDMVSDVQTETYGKDVNSILTEIMGVPDRTPVVAGLFRDFYQSLDAGQYVKAEEILDAIDSMRGYHDKEVAAGRVKLKLAQVCGRQKE